MTMSDDCACIFMGVLSTHHGHQLLQTLAHFGWLQQNKSTCKDIILVFVACVTTCRISSQKDVHRHNPDLQPLFAAIDTVAPQSSVTIKLVTRRENPEGVGFERMLIPTSKGVCPSVFDSAQALFFENLRGHCCRNVPSPSRASRIWASRKSAGSRSVSNEVALESALEFAFGFQAIDFGSLSFVEQVTLCSGAVVLAGFAGTNMHNALFQQRGAQCIVCDWCVPSENRYVQQSAMDISDVCGTFVPWKGVSAGNTAVDISYIVHMVRLAMGEVAGSS